MKTLLQGDCQKLLADIPDKSVDMILCDLPYGVTANKWDTPLSMANLWQHYNRVCTGPVVLTAVQPFTTVLITSNLNSFRYELIWDKGKGSNPLLANKRPMSSHESILVFGRTPVYNPQMKEGTPYKSPRTGGNRTNSNVGAKGDSVGFVQATKDTTKRFPLSVMKYSIHCGSKLHPAQKPEGLMSELIMTFTDPGMTVLDNCMGSGSTGVAALKCNRSFIGMELNQNYFEIAEQQMEGLL